MDRRKFLVGAGLGIMAATAPISLSAMGAATKKTTKSGRMTLKFLPFELKLRHAFNLAKYSRTSTPGVQVKIEYEGVVGYGEASMPPYLGESIETVTKFLSKVDLSQFNDPFKIEEILAYVDAIEPENRAAKASVDIALHDLVGKLIGQPWYKIWGLSLDKIPQSSFTIGIDTPEVVKQKIKEAEDYKVIKIKLGLDNDKEMIDIIRQCTDRPICVDANRGWKTKEQAMQIIEYLADKNCLFIEQPMMEECLDDTAWIRERSPIPIIADEVFHRLPDILKLKDYYDGINIKLMKSTGMSEAYKMITLARAFGMKIMCGCMTETSCAIAAAAQLSPLIDWADLDGNVLIADDIFDGVKVIDGKVTPSDKPGIGITPIKGKYPEF